MGSTTLGAGWRCRLTQGAFRGGVAPCCAPKGSGTELPGLSISWGRNPRVRRQSITYSYSWKVISTQWLSRKRAVSQSYRQAPRVPGCWGCVCILPRVPRSPFVKVPAERRSPCCSALCLRNTGRPFSGAGPHTCTQPGPAPSPGSRGPGLCCGHGLSLGGEFRPVCVE